MQRYEIHLFAYEDEFRVQDDVPGLAAVPRGIAVRAPRGAEVPVTVEIHEARPDVDARAWEEVDTAPLRIDSGRLVVAAGVGELPDAFRIRVRPGVYEALVCRGTGEHRGHFIAVYPGGAARARNPALAVALLDASHVDAYRAFMLRAYAQAPDAFTSTPQEREREPRSWWLERIADPSGDNAAFGCFDGDALVGAVAVELSAKPKTRHKAHLIGMFVVPEARGRGAARLLVEAALDHCRSRAHVTSVVLTVTEGNEPAIALYRKAGFRAFGVEPMALRTPAGYLAKVHMQLALRPAL